VGLCGRNDAEREGGIVELDHLDGGPGWVLSIDPGKKKGVEEGRAWTLKERIHGMNKNRHYLSGFETAALKSRREKGERIGRRVTI